MLTLSSNYPKSEGEQHCGPHPDEGLDDDDFYLNFLREVTHYPDDYHHGPSTAVNMLSPIQESPDFESRSSLGLSHNHQHLLVELVSFAEWPPPPPPLKLFRDVHDPLLTTVAPESPCNLFTNDQYPSSWGPPPPPLPHQSDQPYPISFPQDLPCGPGAHLIPESYSIAASTSEPSSPPSLDIFPYDPISDHAHLEAYGARNSEPIQASTVAAQRSTTDFSATTIPIDEESMHYATPRQALWGIDGFAELSMNGLAAPTIYSAHPSKVASPPNFQSAIHASHHAIVTSSIASSEVVPADDVLRKFWCRACGVSFTQRQGLNRHEREKHGPRNICHLCKSYEWSPARRYLFTRHLKQRHPEAVLD